uniref:Uncharacterized protein n=1 Tax=Lotharella globosa TaxID=91324 RepID=A0A7S3YKJ7_9EUKA
MCEQMLLFSATLATAARWREIYNFQQHTPHYGARSQYRYSWLGFEMDELTVRSPKQEVYRQYHIPRSCHHVDSQELHRDPREHFRQFPEKNSPWVKLFPRSQPHHLLVCESTVDGLNHRCPIPSIGKR